MKEQKLYLVTYEGGDYDDYYTKDIFVTNKKSVATKYCTKFNGILKKWKEHYNQYCDTEYTSVWIKDDCHQYFLRWNSLRNIERAYWQEIEIR